METIHIELTLQEIDIIVAGLMELQAKTILPVLQHIDAQVTQQVKK